MKKDLVRAWKDPLYRAQLEAAGETVSHPTGFVELSTHDLKSVFGMAQTTALQCTEYTSSTRRGCCP